jgi:hypothetical protein
MDRKAKARVAIAFDVLQSVDSLKVDNHGYYLSDLDGTVTIDKYGDDVDVRRQFKGDIKEDATKHLPRLQKCHVCALGACLISQVKLFNKMSISKLVVEDRSNPKHQAIDPNRQIISKLLSKFFCQSQLDLIESAFEIGGDYYSQAPYSVDAEDFGRNYDDPKKRLKAIMANIIVNDGEFCP